MKAKVKTWLEQLESGKIKSKTVIILNYIKQKTGDGEWVTLVDMRRDLNISHQSLTAIISTLCDEGLIYESGQVQIEDKHYTEFVFISTPDARKWAMYKRKEEKLRYWLLRADEFTEFLDQNTYDSLMRIHDHFYENRNNNIVTINK